MEGEEQIENTISSSLKVARAKFLACLNLAFDTKDLFYCTDEKRNSYEVWQQHKQLQAMEINEASPDM